MPDPLPEIWWGERAPLLRQLRGAIATADRALAAGDVSRALAALRRRAVTAVREVQSSARLAAAWLAADPRGTAERLDKAIALSRFVEIAAGHKLSLPIEGAWDAERLRALTEQAERWLADFGQPDA